ncbi:MAG: UbiA family prenyltransferase [Candidatus Diapherotrites archaeon]|uniref:UbiA family prenyltransferase n=1 Tax=Candidatus Iainarchaeum sp. TaxID=3101447 RepID=A0A939C974_9ARCH|nr:UbiA family prenyltransferase [Candidatus Diapherotrites archaeon]
MQVKHFFSILRPFNCVMAAFGAFIGFSIASGQIQFNHAIGVAMLVAFLVCAGGMVINDYFDRHVDKRLHPGKPIPSGAVPAKAALAYSIILFIAGNILALAFLPISSIAIALAFTLLLVIYSAFLSRAKFLGNWVVAAGTAFTLVFGASIIGEYSVVLFFAAAALFANLSREVIKDSEDVEADKGFKKSLPMLLGHGCVCALVFIYYLIAIAAVYFPVLLFSAEKPFFLMVVSAANWLFILSLAKALERKFRKAQKISKIAMAIALVGFLAWVF